jgi:hypothetical protein
MKILLQGQILFRCIYSGHYRIVIPTGTYPDFLPRCTGQDRVCAFPQRKAHEVRQRHQASQEIRGSAVEGPAVLSSTSQGSMKAPLSPLSSRASRGICSAPCGSPKSFPGDPRRMNHPLGMKTQPGFAIPDRSTRLSNKTNLTGSTNPLIWTALTTYSSFRVLIARPIGSQLAKFQVQQGPGSGNSHLGCLSVCLSPQSINRVLTQPRCLADQQRG